jgi:YidC/Oxa1 family membrane protein insertase
MNSEAKRLFLAMFLTFGFLFVWTKYFSPQPAAPVTAQQGTLPVATSPAAPAPTSSASAVTTSSNKTSNAPVAVAKTANIETFETSNKDFSTKFTNQSGSIASIELLHYFKDLKKDSAPVAVAPLAQPTFAPLLWNVALRTSQSEPAKATLNDANVIYAWGDKNPSQISFSTMLAPGVQVQKFYRFTKDPYVIEHVLRIDNKSTESFYVDADTSLSATHIPKTEQRTSFLSPQHPDVQAVAYVHDESLHWKLDDLEKKAQITDPPISWAGFASQYFLLTAIPTEASWTGIKGMAQGEGGTLTMNYAQRTLAPNSNIEYAIKLYAGPKQIEVLEAVHPTLDRSIQLGSWIGGLARTIHKLLGWIYGFIPNYGWAIIILTVLVRLAVFPLAQMQARSMKRMTSHKPAMDALKEKYANDKEAYSRELMSYMRTNKINPASGCLPLLIQFPVFIALYRVLYNSIELRHAPFMFWIHDLSAHDPFFVLPVLVGITFFLQTKLNPTPMADPAQQTMMKIMPVMFSVFMIFLPSGLNLYIFVSTLWGIVQQYMVQKQLT